MLADNARRLRTAQTRAGDLWKDIVFTAFRNRSLDPLDIEHHRFQTATHDHSTELARALQMLEQ